MNLNIKIIKSKIWILSLNEIIIYVSYVENALEFVDGPCDDENMVYLWKDGRIEPMFALELEDLEGELTEELAARMEINDQELVDKSNAYVAIIKETEGTIEAIDAEIKRLQARKKTLNNKVGWLKQTLQGAVILFGEIKTDLFKIGLRSSTAVNIINFDHLPKEYIKEKVDISADKVAIKAALKEGGLVPGAELIKNQNLSIR